MLPGVTGMKGPLSCLTQARFGIAWGAIGAAMACYDEALRYAKDRVQFTRPIAGYQLVQHKLVDMVCRRSPRRSSLCLRLGRLKEAGKMRPQQISLAKRNNVAHGARHRARRARHPRRQRRHRRVPVRPPHAEPRVGLHLRGHARHPHAGRRPGHHRPRGVRLVTPTLSPYRDRRRDAPDVLVCAGLDPSGGAGLIADVRVIGALGAGRSAS